MRGIVQGRAVADSVFHQKMATTPGMHRSIMHAHPQPLPKLQQRHFGVFCRIEGQMAKNSIFAPRFRLGTASYVDWLEGKRDKQ